MKTSAAPGVAGSRSSTTLAGLRVLPWAGCGADVVPGGPRRVHELADELDAVARGLGLMRSLAGEVPRLEWSGAASALCGLVLRQQAERYVAAAQAMASAADAIRSHAAVLQVAQRQADDAVRLDVAAAAATHHWLAAAAGDERVVGAAGDPGASLRRRVLIEVDDARRRVRASAASTAECLHDGARRAPDRPGFASRGVRSLAGFGRDVHQGVAESLTQTLALVVRLDPARSTRDPGGYWIDLAALGEGAAHAVRHPAELAETLADLDTLRESPGRWAGHLLPDVALAVGSAGAVPVAERTATVVARAAARVGPSSVRSPLREALVLQAGTGRGPIRLRDVRAFESAPDLAGYRSRLAPVDAAVSRRVVRDSRWAEAHLRPRLEDAVQEVTGHLPASGRAQVGLQGLDHALKDHSSLARKLASESARAEQTVPVLVPGVNDTVRYTLTLPDGHYVAGAVDTVRAVQARGMTLATVKNFWGSDRYQGLNLTFHDPATGRPLELQVHTPESWQATVDSHPDFEMFRSEAVGPAEKEFYRQRIADRFSIVAMPQDARTLSAYLVPSGALARMTAPLLRTLPDLGLGVGVSTGVHESRSLAWSDDD
jgi:hypothetical protein